MIQFEQLSKNFGAQTLFSGISFQIQSGEKCAILGRNGCGKSTLLRLLAGEEEPDAGKIRLPKGYRFGWLKQHLKFTGSTLLEEAMNGQSEEKQYKAETILTGLGFQKEDFVKPPSIFSGGFQLRLHLCQILLSEPDGLLLDEPTNYLDLPSIRWMQKFLSDWKGELLLISHDRSFVDAICDTCIGIHREKIRKITGTTEKFYQTILQEEEVYERTRLNVEKKRAHLEKFIDRFGAKASKASQAQSRKKSLEKMTSLEKLVDMKSVAFRFRFAPFPGRILLETNELCFSYTSEPLIQNVSLSIEKGERIAIIGKNGRGKSTLLKLLAGEHSPQLGTMKRAENLGIGYFGQTHIDRLLPELSIEEEIERSCPELEKNEVRSLCGQMLFEGDLSQKKIKVLSGGEKSRVLLAKLLATSNHLLLLDEPTHHLDMESIEVLMAALQDFLGSIVLVTHSEHILHAFSPSKILICHENRQELFLGDYATFLEKKGWEESNAISSTLSSESSNRKIDRPKSRSLSTLNREIHRLETLWAALEQEMDFLQKELSNSNRSVEEIQEIAHQLHEKKQTSDRLLEELDLLLKEREAKH